MDGTTHILNLKNDVIGSAILKLSSKIQGNSLNNCDLLKFIFLLGVAVAIICPRCPRTYLRHWVQ
jgi:hypothetical protein